MILLAAVLLAASILNAQPNAFESAETCALCHAALPDTTGQVPLWSGSMMAYSARDPYWKAKLRFEVAATPAAAAMIEDTCLRCHAPMQQYPLRATGGRMRLDDLNPLGSEGASCTVCHQITGDGLGTVRSFEGGFKINPDREIHGPHPDPFFRPMLMHSRYMPLENRAILQSELCATCHTVITPVLDAAGNVRGRFIEQAPYLEWLLSDAPRHGRTCQSCHVPVLKDNAGSPRPAYIAHTPHGGHFPPTSPRTPFGLHSLSGGNVPMLGMMAELFSGEATVLGEGRKRTASMLQGALGLDLSAQVDPERRLRLLVGLTNRTGHKLPTGFPGRRLWLHVAVKDEAGMTVFESGAWDRQTGQIAPAAQPHYDVIELPEQVMVYETQLEDVNGLPTASLMRTARFRKDNRILPSGFDVGRYLPPGVQADQIAAVGVGGDANFGPGSDRVEYRVRIAGQGQYRVTVSACFQSVKPDDVAAMDPGRSPEEKQFAALFLRHNQPLILAERHMTVTVR